MGKTKKICRAGGLVLALSLMISGCGIPAGLPSIGKGEKEYGKAETMVILTTEKLRYEEVYTEEIWNTVVDEDGTTFESALLPQIHDFMIELKTMSNMAKEQEIALTSREKEQVEAASEMYISALGSEQMESFGLKTEDLSALYTDYWLSEKLVEQLTGELNLEVSDSEAKVITVAQIVLSNQEKAEEVLALVQKDGADFNAIAKEYSEVEEIKQSLCRGQNKGAYEDAAFHMEEDEISGVVEDDGVYYILKCVDDYDEEATRARKEQMMQEKKTETFQISYQTYKADHPLTGEKELWEILSIDDALDTQADFFAIYDEVCGAQNGE